MILLYNRSRLIYRRTFVEWILLESAHYFRIEHSRIHILLSQNLFNVEHISDSMLDYPCLRFGRAFLQSVLSFVRAAQLLRREYISLEQKSVYAKKWASSAAQMYPISTKPPLILALQRNNCPVPWIFCLSWRQPTHCSRTERRGIPCLCILFSWTWKQI